MQSYPPWGRKAGADTEYVNAQLPKPHPKTNVPILEGTEAVVGSWDVGSYQRAAAAVGASVSPTFRGAVSFSIRPRMSPRI